jgi:hypothetical protein
VAEEKKNQEVVVPEEEIKEIKSLQEKYQGLALQLGQITLQRSQLTRELENIESNEQKLLVAYDEARESEEEIVKKMTDKYGIGNLDVETGKFTPQN